MFRTGCFAVKWDRAIETAWWDAFISAWFHNGTDHAIDVGAVDDDAPQFVEAE